MRRSHWGLGIFLAVWLLYRVFDKSKANVINVCGVGATGSSGNGGTVVIDGRK